MDIGDIVKCNHCNKDIMFEIIDNKDDIYTLRGLEYRLVTKKEKKDLKLVRMSEVKDEARKTRSIIVEKVEEILKEREQQIDISNSFSGKVLHIDSDGNYLELCMKCYEKLNVRVVGVYVTEENQPIEIQGLLKKHNPDILVVTGHDSYNKKNKEDIENYENSKYFIETVKRAREYNNSKDSLIIIAGACESYYEELIKAGANYGSSPKRVVIHALDPALLAQKMAYTSVNEYLEVNDSIKDIVTNDGGIGGVQTKGSMRSIYPKLKED